MSKIKVRLFVLLAVVVVIGVVAVVAINLFVEDSQSAIEAKAIESASGGQIIVKAPATSSNFQKNHTRTGKYPTKFW